MQIIPSTTTKTNSISGLTADTGTLSFDRSSLFADLFAKHVQALQIKAGRMSSNTLNDIASATQTSSSETIPTLSSDDYQTMQSVFGKYGLDLDQTLAAGRTALNKTVDSVTMDKDDYSAVHTVMRKYGVDDDKSTLSDSQESRSSVTPDAETARKLQVSQDEFNKVKKALEKAGVSDSDINSLQQSVQAGMTWASMLQQIRQIAPQIGKSQLTDDDERNLNALFGKIGFSPDESAKLIQNLKQGANSEVLKAMKDKLASLPSDNNVAVTGNEMSALTKALGLNASENASLKDFFAALNNGETTTKGLSSLLTLVEAGNDATAQAKAVDLGALKGSLENIYADAQSKAGQSTDRHAALSSADSLGKAVDIAKAVNESLAKHTAEDGRNFTGSGAQSGQNGQKDGWLSSGDKSQDEKAWNDFWRNLKDGGTAKTATQLTTPKADTAQSLAQGLATGLGTGQTVKTAVQTPTTGTQTTAKTTPGEIISQVESGLLKNMGQGVKQLTLELKPDDIGKLNVILQVKGKEVAAVIRAESPDAAKTISDQLGQLKQSLEQQGFKVSKLDVQTSLTNDSFSNQWQGAGQHNQAQEQDSRAMSWSRFRAMSGGDQGLVQEMQNGSDAAIVSHEGLDLFA